MRLLVTKIILIILAQPLSAHAGAGFPSDKCDDLVKQGFVAYMVGDAKDDHAKSLEDSRKRGEHTAEEIVEIDLWRQDAQQAYIRAERFANIFSAFCK